MKSILIIIFAHWFMQSCSQKNPCIDLPGSASCNKNGSNSGSGSNNVSPPNPPDTNDQVAPTTPQNLTAILNQFRVTLNWELSTDNVAVTGYRIYQNNTLAVTTPNPPFEIQNLNPNASFVFHVTAVDAAGNESLQSNSVSINTPPTAGGNNLNLPTTGHTFSNVDRYKELQGQLKMPFAEPGESSTLNGWEYLASGGIRFVGPAATTTPPHHSGEGSNSVYTLTYYFDIEADGVYEAHIHQTSPIANAGLWVKFSNASDNSSYVRLYHPQVGASYLSSLSNQNHQPLRLSLSRGTHELKIQGHTPNVVIHHLVLLKNDLHPQINETILNSILLSNKMGSLLSEIDLGNSVTTEGDFLVHHKVTFKATLPSAIPLTEDSAHNTFSNFAFDVKITDPTGLVTIIPGYFAADGNAAESSSSAGRVWLAHFRPKVSGNHSAEFSFLYGPHAATNITIQANSNRAAYNSAPQINFTVSASNKIAPDIRAHGPLVSSSSSSTATKRWVQQGNPTAPIILTGLSSPRNFLAHPDIDGTTVNASLNNRYQAHLSDFIPATDLPWQGSKGTSILGALNYLSNAGINLLSITLNNLNSQNDVHYFITQANRLSKTRFDVSKLAQWQRIFEHAQKKGIFLKIAIAQDLNNLALNSSLDDADAKITFFMNLRELFARFGHLSNIIWSLDDEANLTSIAPDRHPLFAQKALMSRTHLRDFRQGQHFGLQNKLNSLQVHSLPNHHSQVPTDYAAIQLPAGSEHINTFNSLNQLRTTLPGIPLILSRMSGIQSSQDFFLERKHYLYPAFFAKFDGLTLFNQASDNTLVDFTQQASLLRQLKLAKDFLAPALSSVTPWSHFPSNQVSEFYRALKSPDESMYLYYVTDETINISGDLGTGTYQITCIDPVTNVSTPLPNVTFTNESLVQSLGSCADHVTTPDYLLRATKT